ncbi:Uncharacterised protein [Legionella steigerwaltii]|uniref:Uncharacterized protein n=1 Tax=Legionella steigerwaltii TaxID=460 RepID=A0A378L6A3_9GAMM|nr:hypothetical protein [Legionella steigerwaltii]KTD80250.1 hypothetical protein Lstg_0512 [Legionella steigerwaltii]STY22333.1 Uncharacterised protein [Legionella steigerwaltii]
MVQLFTDIGPMLLQYKAANTQGRHTMMLDKMADIKKLSGKVTHKSQVKTHYVVLAYAATLINYADVLHRIENQQYFEVLFDFYGMEMDEELSAWFEFGKTPGQMRLKHPLHEYTLEIWEKFRTAQKKHLEKTNKSHLFNLDQLDISHPPANQLYPIQIQMGGKLENEAVDRINVDAQGRIRFAKHHGFYLLPGGGMLEITNVAKVDDWERKMLEEHLEEEHANLFIKAAELYDQVTPDDFNAALAKAFSSKQAQSLDPELCGWLQEQILTEGNNSTHLHKIVVELDRQIEAAKRSLRDSFGESKERQVTNQNTLKSLIELRAMVQVKPFELTPLFIDAFAYLKKNTLCVDIQQYLDTRVLGGSQTSHTFIMKGQPLEDWFAAKFKGVDGEFGDDISGSEIERLTLLEALSKFRKIKFSHLLIGLAAYEECLDNGTLLVENIWDEARFEQVRKVILEEAVNFSVAL